MRLISTVDFNRIDFPPVETTQYYLALESLQPTYSRLAIQGCAYATPSRRNKNWLF